jgi:hypothetical protein
MNGTYRTYETYVTYKSHKSYKSYFGGVVHVAMSDALKL